MKKNLLKLLFTFLLVVGFSFNISAQQDDKKKPPPKPPPPVIEPKEKPKPKDEDKKKKPPESFEASLEARSKELYI